MPSSTFHCGRPHQRRPEWLGAKCRSCESDSSQGNRRHATMGVFQRAQVRLWSAGDPSDLAAWGEDGNATDDGTRAKVSITNPMTRQAGNAAQEIQV